MIYYASKNVMFITPLLSDDIVYSCSQMTKYYRMKLFGYRTEVVVYILVKIQQ